MRSWPSRGVLIVSFAALVGAGAVVAGPAAAASSTISGVVFHDDNRNGAFDSRETPMSGQTVYLYDGSGSYLGAATTDASGSYSFGGLADGQYRVDYSSASWSQLRNSYVPTTTATLKPTESVAVAGSGIADFGWRPLVSSSDLNNPIASWTAGNGLRIYTYNDALTPQQVYAALSAGSLIGPEAADTNIRFAYGTANQTVTSTQQSGSTYTAYGATVYVTYASWLDTGDTALFHEYGHAWSLYHAYLSQQDPTFGSYLRARGLSGDSRVNSTYVWDPREMIAEDYRQLFGSAHAASVAQANTDIPPAASVPGLADFLRNTFTTSSTSTSSGPASTPPAVPTVSGLAVSPLPVQSQATVSASISTAATVTITVTTASGSVVKTLLSKASPTGGTVTASWDRTNTKGQRVKNGSYVVVVTATNSTGSGSASLAIKAS
jgi:hypothetical protein